MEMSMTTAEAGPSWRSRAPQDMFDGMAKYWWAAALRGVAAIVFAAMALIWPGVTMLSIVLVFAAYAAVDGILAIIGVAREIRRKGQWGALAFEGVVSLAVAAAAILWPGLTLLAFVFLVGAWAVVSGFLMIWGALKLPPKTGRWWLVLSGVSSAVLGGFLAFFPPIGAIVLTLWLGAYALVFGVLHIVFAVRLLLANRKNVAHPAPSPAT
jgi:uncharacterized membrane protein HdeD (DUF308 family)